MAITFVQLHHIGMAKFVFGKRVSALISRPVAKHVVHYGVINACTKDENRKIRASGLDIKQLFCQVYLDCDKLLIPLQWPLILQAIHTCFAMPIHIFKRCYIFGTHNMWKYASHDTQTILQIHRCEIVFSAIVNLMLWICVLVYICSKCSASNPDSVWLNKCEILTERR